MKLETAICDQDDEKGSATMREVEKIQYALLDKYMELASNLCSSSDPYGVWHVMSERQKLERLMRTMQQRYGERR